MTGAANTLSAVTSYIQRYFEVPHEDLSPSTDLVERFNRADPDRFTDFLEDVSKEFTIRLPRIADRRKYLADRWAEHGLRLSDLIRAITGTPAMYVDSLSLGELCKIIEDGEWPPQYSANNTRRSGRA